MYSGFLNQASLDCLHGDEHAFDSAIGQSDADALQVRTELAFGDARYVSADAAALLALSLAIDGAARGRTLTCDCTNSCHGLSS